MPAYHNENSSAHRPPKASCLDSSIRLPTHLNAGRPLDTVELVSRMQWNYVQCTAFRRQGEVAEDEGNGKSLWTTWQAPDQSGNRWGNRIGTPFPPSILVDADRGLNRV